MKKAEVRKGISAAFSRGRGDAEIAQSLHRENPVNVTARLTLAVRPRQDCCNSVVAAQPLQSRNDDKALALPYFRRALRETPCVHRHVCRSPEPFATVARLDPAGE